MPPVLIFLTKNPPRPTHPIVQAAVWQLVRAMCSEVLGGGGITSLLISPIKVTKMRQTLAIERRDEKERHTE